MSSTLAKPVDHFVSNDGQIGQLKHTFLFGNMPNTIRVMDHTQAHHLREWECVNRKERHSITIQLVGDADLVITNYVVK